jgi:hypothetical protein
MAEYSLKLQNLFGDKMMKRMTDYPLILTAAAFLAGITGCANLDKTNNTCEVTTPTCTQPADDTSCVTSCETDCEVICETEITVETPKRHAREKQFDQMIYNAELADMTLADIHFLPQRSALNSTGTQKLNHLAWLTDNYGGSIKLDLNDPKGELASARVKNVKAYLKCWGLSEEKIKVKIGLSDYEGLKATEAIIIHNDTRYQKAGR